MIALDQMLECKKEDHAEKQNRANSRENTIKLMYGYACELCEGTVQPRSLEREAFKHKSGFVILENVVVGVCDTCGNRFYSADILHTIHAVATGRQTPERTEAIPVAHLSLPLAGD